VGVGIENEEAVYPLRMAGRPVEADRTSPVLRDDGGASELKRLQQGVEPFRVTGDAVELRIVRLVRPPEAEMIGNDRPVARFHQGWDEVAVQVAPGRVAMHHHHRPTVGWALIDVVHAAVG
jgi:hypothetical protein